MDRALFMPDEYVLDLFLLEKLVVDVEDRATRIAEDVLDALFLETADDDLGARELHGIALVAHSRVGEVDPRVVATLGFPWTPVARDTGKRALQRLDWWNLQRLECSGPAPRDSPMTLMAPPEGAQWTVYCSTATAVR